MSGEHRPVVAHSALVESLFTAIATIDIAVDDLDGVLERKLRSELASEAELMRQRRWSKESYIDTFLEASRFEDPGTLLRMHLSTSNITVHELLRLHPSGIQSWLALQSLLSLPLVALDGLGPQEDFRGQVTASVNNVSLLSFLESEPGLPHYQEAVVSPLKKESFEKVFYSHQSSLPIGLFNSNSSAVATSSALFVLQLLRTHTVQGLILERDDSEANSRRQREKRREQTLDAAVGTESMDANNNNSNVRSTSNFAQSRGEKKNFVKPTENRFSSHNTRKRGLGLLAPALNARRGDRLRMFEHRLLRFAGMTIGAPIRLAVCTLQVVQSILNRATEWIQIDALPSLSMFIFSNSTASETDASAFDFSDMSAPSDLLSRDADTQRNSYVLDLSCMVRAKQERNDPNALRLSPQFWSAHLGKYHECYRQYLLEKVVKSAWFTVSDIVTSIFPEVDCDVDAADSWCVFWNASNYPWYFLFPPVDKEYNRPEVLALLGIQEYLHLLAKDFEHLYALQYDMISRTAQGWPTSMALDPSLSSGSPFSDTESAETIVSSAGNATSNVNIRGETTVDQQFVPSTSIVEGAKDRLHQGVTDGSKRGVLNEEEIFSRWEIMLNEVCTLSYQALSLPLNSSSHLPTIRSFFSRHGIQWNPASTVTGSLSHDPNTRHSDATNSGSDLSLPIALQLCPLRSFSILLDLHAVRESCRAYGHFRNHACHALPIPSNQAAVAGVRWAWKWSGWATHADTAVPTPTPAAAAAFVAEHSFAFYEEIASTELLRLLLDHAEALPLSEVFAPWWPQDPATAILQRTPPFQFGSSENVGETLGNVLIRKRHSDGFVRLDEKKVEHTWMTQVYASEPGRNMKKDTVLLRYHVPHSLHSHGAAQSESKICMERVSTRTVFDALQLWRKDKIMDQEQIPPVRVALSSRLANAARFLTQYLKQTTLGIGSFSDDTSSSHALGFLSFADIFNVMYNWITAPTMALQLIIDPPRGISNSKSLFFTETRGASTEQSFSLLDLLSFPLSPCMKDLHSSLPNIGISATCSHDFSVDYTVDGIALTNATIFHPLFC